MVTAESLFGMSKTEYLQDFPGDEEEADHAYDEYIVMYEQIATCINGGDVPGLKKLARKFDMPREDVVDFMDMMAE